MSGFETPMMQQYLELKKEYNDCILFFRLGDFYELFLEDAELGAKLLGITLTSRDRGKDGKIPMAGVPYHAVDAYLAKLVSHGHKVAICEQVGEVTTGSLVERDVVRVVTPGTILEEGALNNKDNNYIVSISHNGKDLGIALADISTGEFRIMEYRGVKDLRLTLGEEFSRYSPKECILHSSHYNDPSFLKKVNFDKTINIYPFHNWDLFASDEKTAEGVISDHFEIKTLHTYKMEDSPNALLASAALIGYLRHTQKSSLKHIKSIQREFGGDNITLDRATIFNLELFNTIRNSKYEGSLLSVLDHTKTAMGGRLLKKWLVHPLADRQQVEFRHDGVDFFIHNSQERDTINSLLAGIYDIERILSRLSMGVGNPKIMISLKNSIRNILSIKSTCVEYSSPYLKEISENLPNEISRVSGVIERFIQDEPQTDVKGGGIIKSGVHNRLDELRNTINKSKEWISDYEDAQKKRTGINSLKVKFNQVFGYYIEVSKPNLSLVPKDYERKQTMVNAERFVTQELKEQEEIVLTAEEKINELEYELYMEIIKEVTKYTEYIQEAARNIAELDCIMSFAYISLRNQYVKPKFVNSGRIEIKDGRHPVVEQLLEDNAFVPNDVILDKKENQLLLITGPNMAGKSVFIRQVAIVSLMAQIGCFVPASSAKLSIVDKIFVRSGASDVITEGLSTFMVEMVEAAYILNNATSESLIVMDEIGRGTSTYDGISIASSIAQYLVTNYENGGPKTLFATHYHELQELEKKYTGVKNYQVVVKYEDGDPVFLHKVIEGGASHSFGLAVAKMAGVPHKVVSRAQVLLDKLENGSTNGASTLSQKQDNQKVELPNYLKEIKKLNINEITPLEAFEVLSNLQSELKEDG